MNVLMISPGFPDEMPHFTRGLARVGAKVIGMGDPPESSLDPGVRECLSAYIHVASLADEEAVISKVRDFASRVAIDRVECLWEPFMILAARLRETMGLPGMTVEETIPFRDKEVMKQRLDAAGIRTPRHASTTSAAGCRKAAEAIGYPLIVKPIAGAGSSDTYRADSASDLEKILPKVRHVTEVSVEEFVEGEDCTYDTLCVDGEIQHLNMSFYRPRALTARNNEWISPQTVVVRDLTLPRFSEGRKMGEAVLKALDFKTGMTHMEWYRKEDGEAVFGEIAARPIGARVIDLMNYASDVDMYTGWAEVACHRRFSQTVERKYNAVSIFKRAQGEGRIQRIEGLTGIMAELGPHICALELLPIGARRRNWLQTLVSDGMIVLRHPDLETVMEMADRVGTRLQLYAG